MRRRLAAILLAAALVPALCGCASLYEKEYFSTSQYEDTDTDVSDSGATEIRSYFGLKLAVSQLVSAHEETGTLDFRNYDGDINSDIAAACKEISTNTALGEYSVDYISYDLDRIVAYYEANIYVTYTRTAAEMQAIQTATGSSGLFDCIVGALDALDTQLVVMASTGNIGEDDVEDFISRACRENPLYCPAAPAADVKVYSGNGVQKIFEISLDYGGKSTKTLLAMREQLTGAVNQMAETVTSEGDAYRALQAASLLIARCAYDEAGGSTAYDAVIGGTADSEGMAMAYCALAKAAGLECSVVGGRMDKKPHYWNIFQADGDYYHADLSRAAADGFAKTFLMSDAAMWGKYWWDTELYPVCEGALTYAGLLETQTETQTPAQQNT